jgi:organic radical activating enzyme
MTIDRRNLYRLPWSVTDNPGGWVEVTDTCDMVCPGCYRHRLEGHRPLEQVKRDIHLCREKTNCDRMAIAGGEPLLYPDIVEVVDYVARLGMKPLLLTNGQHLTPELGKALKDAGLVRFHFHVDSGQPRKGWEGKSERELNVLRQQFADFTWELGGVQCGYNVTVKRSTMHEVPEIIAWCYANIERVHHMSLVAYRAIPVVEGMEYLAKGRPIDPRIFQHSSTHPEELDITTVEMCELIQKRFPDFEPGTYLNGTAVPDTYKFLAAVHIGSRGGIYGTMGPRAVETVQTGYHLFRRKYFDFLRSPVAGKRVFLLSVLDRRVRRALGRYAKAALINPRRLFEQIMVQTISLQQPNEILNGEANLCEGCLNMMIHNGELIRSCRLDEYRMFGAPVIPVMHDITEERNLLRRMETVSGMSEEGRNR